MVRRQREDWLKHRIPAASKHPERVVFIDETSVKTNLTRQRGWAPCGDRLVMDAPFVSWGTQTFIAGLSADAMIAPWVIKGAMDGPAFAAYIEKVLAPELSPGTVVVLDNLATHENAEAARAMRNAGCWFLFLPPNSPDLNPIEMAFSKLKAHLRRIGARTGNDKGKVEGLVGYGRRNFMVPISCMQACTAGQWMPRFTDWDAFNEYLEEQCRKRQADILRGHKISIGDRLMADLAAMRELPGAPFEACDLQSGQVTSTSQVRYRGNDYSVPVAYGHREVWIKGFVDRVVIGCAAEVIADHPQPQQDDGSGTGAL